MYPLKLRGLVLGDLSTRAWRGLGAPPRHGSHLKYGSLPHALQEEEDELAAFMQPVQLACLQLDRNLRRLCHDLQVGFMGSRV